jgi:hypothetical protein
MQHIPRDKMVSTFAAALNAYAHATSTPDEPAVAATAPAPTEPAAAPADAAAATTQQPSPTAATTASTITADGDVDNHSGTGDAQPTAIALPDADDGGRSRWLRMAAMPLPELARALQASDPAQPTVATRAAIKSVRFMLHTCVRARARREANMVVCVCGLQMELWLEKGLQSLSVVCHVCRSSRTADFPELLVRCSYCYKVRAIAVFVVSLVVSCRVVCVA